MQSLETILEYALGGLAFLVVITVLVFVHELGHYWLAKANGMAVDSFAVMIGGRRVTALESRLDRPLAPKKLVWLAAVVCLGVIFLGSLLKIPTLTLIGLCLLSIGMPIWVTARLGLLYHLDIVSSFKNLVVCWVGAIAVLLFSTKGTGVEATQALTVLGMASGLAIILLYYKPVLGKGEDSTMGEGSIEINGERVNVQYRPLISRKNKEGTEFSLLMIPAGGFASIRGMAPKPDASETKIEKGFYSKHPLQRLIVLFAGPLFSIVFGIILITILYSTVGEAQPVNKPIIGSIAKDMPAHAAGMRAGDRFLTIDGKKMETFFDVIKVVRESPNRELEVVYERKGKVYKTNLKPILGPEETPVFSPTLEPTGETKRQGLAGMMWDTQFVRQPPLTALQKGVALPFKMIGDLVNIAKKPSRAKNELGGPGTIAAIAVDAAKQGVTTVILLAALLSISLGIMNLLPIFPLDGGQMVVAFIELLRGGKRLSMQVQSLVSTSGFFLVLALAATMLAMDVNRFVGKDSKSKTSKVQQTIADTPEEKQK